MRKVLVHKALVEALGERRLIRNRVGDLLNMAIGPLAQIQRRCGSAPGTSRKQGEQYAAPPLPVARRCQSISGSREETPDRAMHIKALTGSTTPLAARPQLAVETPDHARTSGSTKWSICRSAVRRSRSRRCSGGSRATPALGAGAEQAGLGSDTVIGAQPCLTPPTPRRLVAETAHDNKRIRRGRGPLPADGGSDRRPVLRRPIPISRYLAQPMPALRDRLPTGQALPGCGAGAPVTSADRSGAAIEHATSRARRMRS